MMKRNDNWENEILRIVRWEHECGYEYILVQLSEYRFATVHSYKKTGYYIQEIGMINEELVKELTIFEFIDDHAIIHITPNKHAKIWRNKEFR